MRRPPTFVVTLALLSAAGCETSAPPDPADSAVPDAGPRDAGPLPSGRCLVESSVDLLFVVDNTSSMAEEQATFVAAIPALLRALTDPASDPDHPPIRDLQIGVITGDMGTGGATVPTCTKAGFGDDGLLRSDGNRRNPSCAFVYPSFLRYVADVGPDLDEYGADAQCVVEVGTGGCGFQQPLEAALKALSPSTAPVTFHGDTRGHGDGPNEGFLRTASLLAVIFVTDQDDCSAADVALFAPEGTRYPGPLLLRCSTHSSALHPIARFATGLRALRPVRPDLLAVAVVAGVPADLEGRSAAEILADPRMEEREDDGYPTPRLVPSCDDPTRGTTFPPRRLVMLSQEFPEQSTVHSICPADGSGAAAGVAALVRRRACEVFERSAAE